MNRALPWDHQHGTAGKLPLSHGAGGMSDLMNYESLLLVRLAPLDLPQARKLSGEGWEKGGGGGGGGGTIGIFW